MTRTILLASLLASADALVLGNGISTCVIAAARASSLAMLWDPTKDDVAGQPRKSHLLQHTEESLPVYVGPGPAYTPPDDGCEQVELDQYASIVFGKHAGKQEAWVCADEETSESAGLTECNFVMHKGELIKACI
mmetsp:Transcript_33345/g.71213  ORF Transcript_33345/g.71213 Transcript_33345/m.71213 type:complete len:135 (-) Transcript_33345:494-898(-)|eukprot:CAMPEP_0183330708 /NCGR_PEP_ID=MMETSP0164_2-20130417/119_1 /TAXON_ID=221442 /ORGANISM="Coccolithus pelagicus ssp braarudi, Strain PLY182g" /LENGTH=134 /DNA_ID=CAMNT_0025498957 /DNA_START=18 /DNA_END=422 /DNA_ORIENTATION=-